MPHDARGQLTIPDTVVPTSLENPALGRFQWYSKQTGQIFPHLPKYGDIKQGCIGNCYTMAAIASVVWLPSGPDLIERMLRDTDDGFVVMRLYWDEAWNYYKVEKSIVTRTKPGRLHSRGPVWVNMLEKAFLTLQGKTYGTEEGGNAVLILKALLGPDDFGNLGGAADNRKQFEGREEQFTAFYHLMRTLFGDNDYLDSQKEKARKAKEVVTSQVFPGEIGDDQFPSVKKWIDWYNHGLRQKWAAIENHTWVAIEDYLEFMREHGTGLDQTVFDTVVAWVQQHELFSYRFLSGQYTAEQLSFFGKIARYLAMQRPVTVATPRELQGKKAMLSGHSGGESRVDGIFAEHAYSVFDTKRDADGFCYVEVRNPHGFMGRGYSKQSDGTLKPETSVWSSRSWIELGDFLITFPEVHFGSEAVTDERAAFNQQLKEAVAKRADELQCSVCGVDLTDTNTRPQDKGICKSCAWEKHEQESASSAFGILPSSNSSPMPKDPDPPSQASQFF